MGDSVKKASKKKDYCGYGCPKKGCDHTSCRSGLKEISSVERVIQKAKGEVNEVRATPGWERVRVLVDSGAIDTIGPKGDGASLRDEGDGDVQKRHRIYSSKWERYQELR